MRFFFLLFAGVLFLSGCAGEKKAQAVRADVRPRAHSAMNGFGLEPVERRAFLAADKETTEICARNRAEPDIPRAVYAAFDECATKIFDKYMLPVTAYPEEFRRFRARGREAAREYQQGNIPFARLQEEKRIAWVAYLQERQIRPVSSFELFQMRDAEARASFERTVQGAPGVVSTRCEDFGC